MKALPDFNLSLSHPSWDEVYTIPMGTLLTKGRHGLYHDICAAAANVTLRFLCYSWGTPSRVSYVGSVSQDYKRGSFTSNLQARVHNYLQNHRESETGRVNTNLAVFQHINDTLRKEDVVLRVFRFATMIGGEAAVDFASYSQHPELVRAIERLLVWYHKQNGEAEWNRH